MPPPVASRKVSELLPWAGAWLPAGDLVLEGGQVATVSFDRGGHCRLLLALDRPAEDEDVLALEEAAEALPYLQLSDLEGGAGYPARHADAFALREPLSSFAFNSSARVELVARRGGRRLPPRLGTFGLATTTSFLGDPLPEAGRLEAPPSEPEAQRPEAPDAEPETTAGLAVAQTPEAPAHVVEAEAPEPRAHTAEAEAPDPEMRAPSAEAEAPEAQALAPEAQPAARARAAPEADGLATAAPDMAAPDMAAPDMAAPDMAAAAPDVAAVGAPGTGLERGLGALGARLTAATGLAGTTLGLIMLGLAVAVFVGVFVAQTWALHRHFGTYGFDVGIYDQGTWLLSRLRAPFVTVRGLNLFGDHASYILILVAPLYRLWPDPRLLLLLQAVALAVPAWVVYRLGARHLGNPAAGLAVAIAYLAFPAMQWALTWQFHPEALAAAFLALAALAADDRRSRLMAVWLGLALLCREDVGLVVAGFGGLLMLTGQRTVGRRVLLAGLIWWVLATFLFIAWANGRQTNLFELNYGISGVGPIALLKALPSMAGRALATALSNQGLGYLLLVLVPLLGLPLLAPKALLPVAPALFLNLAAIPPEQHQIRYQYLATSAPFLAIAAVAGLQVVASRRRALLAPLLIALVVASLVMDQRFGPAPWSHDKIVATASPGDQARRRALAMIPADAPVSAQFNLVPHLSHRVKIFEFPNPFKATNWGLSGDVHAASDQQELRYVVVDRSLLDKDQKTLLKDLQASPDWATKLDSDNVVLLERRGTGGNR
jgi:uncharacterized membrane protein